MKNTHTTVDPVLIPLLNGRGYVSVSPEDAPLATQFRWHLTAGKYAAARVGGKAVYLHRMIVGRINTDLPDRWEVDHIDRDGLNCCRANLRAATRSQNLANRGRFRNSTSGYKGVVRKGDKWVATIRCSNESYYLGVHPTAEAAARVYDAKARELFGEFAGTNFPAQ